MAVPECWLEGPLSGGSPANWMNPRAKGDETSCGETKCCLGGFMAEVSHGVCVDRRSWKKLWKEILEDALGHPMYLGVVCELMFSEA